MLESRASLLIAPEWKRTMGEHTVREVLKRRSVDTQRVLQRRRELASRARGKRSVAPVAILVLVLLAIVAVVVYAGWLANAVSGRFAADRIQRNTAPDAQALNLQKVTAFLPNTVLTLLDPKFYGSSNTRVSPVTARLVRLYFPDASAPAVAIMGITLQFNYNRTNILEAYINDAPVGNAAGQPVHGMAAASQAYFHKPFAQLQVQDIALLAGLLNRPMDPRSDPAQALSLRNAVLAQDVQQGVLSQKQGDELSKTPLDFGS